jgi:hypothetical protein
MSGPNAKPPRPISLEALSNGFAWCDDPAGCKKSATQLGPEHIQVFFDRWLDVIPTPLGDRQLHRQLHTEHLPCSRCVKPVTLCELVTTVKLWATKEP